MSIALETPHLPLAGKRLRQQSSRDDRIKLGFMAVIGLYLIVALGAPLFVMLSKSLSTYRFDLAAFEFQVSDETGANWGPVVSAAQLNETLGAVPESELSSNSDGRLAATKFFPEFKFRSPVHYRIRGTTADAAFLVGSTLEKGTEWRDYDSGTFRRVVLRPARGLGLDNFVAYFSTPALAQSIYNSVLMAAISTVFTVAIAFALAYGLTRSCMPLKGLFRGVLTIPILVPSLLPGIALVYLFGNQGVFKDWLMGYSIYGPIGIVIGSVFFTLPHAFLIILTALSVADARHYEAAASLKASKWRTFTTVTWPAIRPTLWAVAVLELVIGYKVFDSIVVITSGGPGFSTALTPFVIYQTGLRGSFDMGTAAPLKSALTQAPTRLKMTAKTTSTMMPAMTRRISERLMG